MNSDELRQLAQLLRNAANSLSEAAEVLHTGKNQIGGNDESVWDLQIGSRARNLLWRNGISTLNELMCLTPGELLTFRNCGITTLHEIQLMLGDRGLSLKNDKVWSRG